MKDPYYNALVAFKQVSELDFGTELYHSWRKNLQDLKDVINTCTCWFSRHATNSKVTFPPCAMGKEEENSGEALHHIGKKMKES